MGAKQLHASVDELTVACFISIFLKLTNSGPLLIIGFFHVTHAIRLRLHNYSETNDICSIGRISHPKKQ